MTDLFACVNSIFPEDGRTCTIRGDPHPPASVLKYPPPPSPCDILLTDLFARMNPIFPQDGRTTRGDPHPASVLEYPPPPMLCLLTDLFACVNPIFYGGRAYYPW